MAQEHGPATTPVEHLTSDCGPHCGIDGFSAYTNVGHCPGCHNRTCEGSRYDRGLVKPA